MIRKKRILDFHSFFAEKNPANLQIKESEIPAIPDFSDKDTKGTVTLKEYKEAFNPKIGIGRVCERLRSEGRFEGIKDLLELYFIEQYKKIPEYSKNPHLYQEYVDKSLKWYTMSDSEREKQLVSMYTKLEQAKLIAIRTTKLGRYFQNLMKGVQWVIKPLAHLTACAGFADVQGKKAGFIIFDPIFMDYVKTEQAAFVVLHEVYHLLQNHSLSKEGRPIRKWNEAADYEINQILIASHELKMPEGPMKGLFDPKFNNKNAQIIYDELFPESPEDPKKDNSIKEDGDEEEENENGEGGEEGEEGEEGGEESGKEGEEEAGKKGEGGGEEGNGEGEKEGEGGGNGEGEEEGEKEGQGENEKPGEKNGKKDDKGKDNKKTRFKIGDTVQTPKGIGRINNIFPDGKYEISFDV